MKSLQIREKKSPLGLAALTMILLGLQFLWSVEFTWGSAYLESLGIRKTGISLTSGPVSALITQPVAGALSDRCASKWGRRRPYMVGGVIVCLLALGLLVFARELGRSEPTGTATPASLGLAILGIWMMDFSLSITQTSARALIVDTVPVEQQSTANAVGAVMAASGGIFGNLAGFCDLSATVGVRTVQIKLLAGLAAGILALTTLVTVLGVREAPLPASLIPSRRGAGLARAIFKPIADVRYWLQHIPTSVRNLCAAQFFAWIAWFPFVFFKTKYVAQWAANSRIPSSISPEVDLHASRMGAFSALLYYVANLLLSLTVPALTNYFGVSLPVIWIVGEMAAFLVLWSTFFVSDVVGAIAIVVAMAFSWAIGVWVPFALIGQILAANEPKSASPTLRFPSFSHAGDTSPVGKELDTLSLPRAGLPPLRGAEMDISTFDRRPSSALSGTMSSAGSISSEANLPQGLSSGTVLGIYNIFIISPQVLVAIMSAIVFAVIPDNGEPPKSGSANDALGWIFRFGGVMALVAAVIIRRKMT